MASNLFVAFPCHSVFLQIAAFKYSILPVFVLDFQDGFLDSQFPALLFRRSYLLVHICEKVERLWAFLLVGFRELDEVKRAIMMVDGTQIPIEDVRYIEGDLFRLSEQT